MAVRGKLGHRLSARDRWSFERPEHQEAARQAAGDVQEITGAEGVCEQADHAQQDRRCHGQASGRRSFIGRSSVLACEPLFFRQVHLLGTLAILSRISYDIVCAGYNRGGPRSCRATRAFADASRPISLRRAGTATVGADVPAGGAACRTQAGWTCGGMTPIAPGVDRNQLRRR